MVLSPLPFLKSLFTFFIIISTMAATVADDTAKPVTYASHAGIPSCHMNMGPTGAKAWMRGYQFVIMSIDPGSPAHNVLQPADVIVAVDGIHFGPENDSRIVLGNAIGRAEADGKPLNMTLIREGTQQTVPIELPKLGAYSDAWPANCPKSDQLLDAACRSLRLAQLPNGQIITDGNMGTYLAGLLMLASADPKYLDGARRAAYQVAAQDDRNASLNNWGAGYGGVLLAEYYLATGDDSVLESLKAKCDLLADGQMACGSWGHTTPHGAYGALNQPGVVCAMALVLAKRCGVDVNEDVMNKALEFFAQYAELGAVPYGDHFPYANNLDSNGRNATAAILMRLAGREREAKAFASAVALSYWEREEGHTGGFFSMTWGPLAAIMTDESRFRTFMDYQKWHYNLTHNWKGELVHIPYYEALTRFDSNAYVEFGGDFTTGGFGLVYALPRKHLRILGAPASVFAAESKMSADLAQAKQHYLAREWASCDKVLSTIKADELTSESEKYWLKQLIAARKLIEASVERTLMEAENNLMESAPYRASEQVAALKRCLGAEYDNRFEAIDALLSSQEYHIREGKKFYESWTGLYKYKFMGWVAQGAMAKEMLSPLPSLHMPIWEPLSAISKNVAQPWKTLLLRGDETLPKGWQGTTFDDGTWIAKDGISTRYTMGAELEKAAKEKADGEKRELTKEEKSALAKAKASIPSGAIAARRWFTFDKPMTSAASLKMYLQTVRPTFTKVYLNGELIVDAVRGKRGGYATIQLDDSVKGLLRNGRNLLAVSCDKQGQGNNHLDVGIYVNFKPVEKRTLTPIRTHALVLSDLDTDATLRVRETKDKMKKAFEEGIMSEEIPELLDRLSEPVGVVRHIAERGLAAKGTAGLEAAIKLASSDDWRQRAAYCGVLQNLLRAEAQKDSDAFKEEVAAAQKAGKVPPKATKGPWNPVNDEVAALIKKHLPTIQLLLADQNGWVRFRALSAIRSCGELGRTALPKVTTMIQDPHPWVRVGAISSVKYLEPDVDAQVAAAVQALEVYNTAYSVPQQALAIFKSSPKNTAAKLEALARLIKNPPQGGGGRALVQSIEYAVTLDPDGAVLIPALIESLGKFGIKQQQAGPAGKALKILEAYGDKAKPAIPVLKSILASDDKRNKGLHQPAIELLKKLGEDVTIYETEKTNN